MSNQSCNSLKINDLRNATPSGSFVCNSLKINDLQIRLIDVRRVFDYLGYLNLNFAILVKSQEKNKKRKFLSLWVFGTILHACPTSTTHSPTSSKMQSSKLSFPKQTSPPFSRVLSCPPLSLLMCRKSLKARRMLSTRLSLPLKKSKKLFWFLDHCNSLKPKGLRKRDPEGVRIS